MGSFLKIYCFECGKKCYHSWIYLVLILLIGIIIGLMAGELA